MRSDSANFLTSKLGSDRGLQLITSHSAPILYVQGRQHPVKVYYTENHQEDYVESALRTLFQIHMNHESGDVLVFLSGIPSRFDKRPSADSLR